MMKAYKSGVSAVWDATSRRACLNANKGCDPHGHSGTAWHGASCDEGSQVHLFREPEWHPNGWHTIGTGSRSARFAPDRTSWWGCRVPDNPSRRGDRAAGTFPAAGGD